MGLDMVLTGEKFFPCFIENRPLDVDGDPIQQVEVELGYWRKFAPLHLYIVKTFADGRDEGQNINLHEEQLVQVAEAIMAETLTPHEGSTGYFFGNDEIWDEYRADKAEHAATFIKASEWLRQRPESQWRSVTYRASW